VVALVCISLTLYGGGCVFIVLISQLLGGLITSIFHLHLCQWMPLVAAILIPLTWAGTPKVGSLFYYLILHITVMQDFWPIAVGALITTLVACSLIIVSCILKGGELQEMKVNGTLNDVALNFPSPTFSGSFKGELYALTLVVLTFLFAAFGSIMFAFAGASTFPTIQADMADRSKFNISALLAMAILFIIYFPMAVGCYYSLGQGDMGVTDNIVLAMPEGWMKILVQVRTLKFLADLHVPDNAAPPSGHRLPHHHQPASPVLRAASQYPLK
jgi:vesicular inhibitory amino acid transporter